MHDSIKIEPVLWSIGHYAAYQPVSVPERGADSSENPALGGSGVSIGKRGLGGSTRFMDKTREGAKRFKPELKNSNTA
jgi:hypothetical protein